MSSILRTIGIDISKDWLDAFASPEGRASRFSNDAAGFRKLIAWIGSEVDRIAYEPTGPFHRDFEDTLLKAGLPPVRDQPLPGPVLRPLPRPARQDRCRGRPDFGHHGGGRRGSAPGSSEIGGTARSRRTPTDPRRAAEGPSRHHQPRQALAHSRGQAAHQADAEADQAPAESHRRRDPATARGGGGPGAPGPDLHPGHLGHHRRGTDHPHAGAGHAHPAPVPPASPDSPRSPGSPDTGRDAASSRAAGTGCAGCSTCPLWLRSSTIPTSSGSTRRSWPRGNRRRSP